MNLDFLFSFAPDGFGHAVMERAPVFDIHPLAHERGSPPISLVARHVDVTDATVAASDEQGIDLCDLTCCDSV
jgi:hypothetical protein